MGHLLVTRSSLDTHQWTQVSDFKIDLCQNEAKAMEAIMEAKAHCEAIIREVQKPAVLLILEKGSPAVKNMLIPSNNWMQRVCNVWKQKPWKRRGETTSPS